MRRRKKEPEIESHERWLVSYADLVTLLFAFFTVLYAISETNSEKSKQFEESVKQYLVKVGVVGIGGGANSTAESGAGKGDKLKHKLQSRIENPLHKHDKKSDTAEALQYKVETYLEEEFHNQQLSSIFANISADSVGVRLSLLADSIFEGNSVKLKKSSLKTINKIAEILKDNRYRILVEGHATDETAKRGSFTSGWDLAAARSALIVRYLIKVHKMEPKRLVAMSYGGQVPFNNEDMNDKRNQRLSFLILTEPIPF